MWEKVKPIMVTNERLYKSRFVQVRNLNAKLMLYVVLILWTLSDAEALYELVLKCLRLLHQS